MYQEISLRLSDGSEQNFPFLATGTTAYRFKQVFHQDLMILLNKMENSEDDQTDMTVGDKLAFIMAAASKASSGQLWMLINRSGKQDFPRSMI